MNKKDFDRKIKALKYVRNSIYEPYFTAIDIVLLIAAVLAFIVAISMSNGALQYYLACTALLAILAYRINTKRKVRAYINSRS